MKTIVIGASGTIGKAVADALRARGHEVIEASRKGRHAVDLSDKASITRLFDTVGKVDHVVSCAGAASFKPLLGLDDADLDLCLGNKLIGNIRVVQEAAKRVSDGGSVTVTSGIFSRNPIPGVPAIAAANGGLESFVRAAALDVQRGVRLNVVCPPFITETARAMGMPTAGTLSAADNARAYVALVEGTQNGAVVYSGDRG